MKVRTKNSTYEIELGEGFEVMFQRVEGKHDATYSKYFADRKYRGVIDGPLAIGHELRIQRINDEEWPAAVDSNQILTTPILEIIRDPSA